MTWLELETRFKELEMDFRYARLDGQTGAAGEYWRFAGQVSDDASERLKILAAMAANKLSDDLGNDAKNYDFFEEKNPTTRWYKVLKTMSGRWQDVQYAIQEDGSFIYMGNIGNPASVSAVLALQFSAQFEQKKPEVPKKSPENTKIEVKATMQQGTDIGLTDAEINKVVHKYIGVHGGYLADFSYASHQQFYYVDCDLSHIVVDNFAGTTRERFIRILRDQNVGDQAKILRGVLARFTLDSGPDINDHKNRAETLPFVQSLIKRLESGGLAVAIPAPKAASEIVRQALADAKVLLKESGPVNAVDRIHTALHGYLLQICESSDISHSKDLEITGLLKLVKKQHPAFKNLPGEIERILGAHATIVDALNPVRNQKSLAHPNKFLLESAEATLVINTVSSLLTYLEDRIQAT